ncbi:indole-3-glycerol-phosphate synthase [Methanospirillum lacunae]|uniref:Indole-3-glycerol phosphate synthase n=1 Tax=Methanospirillum lacunae TaxID=668570 RepID=A0A2V2MYR7_9EURY|nr:indole-3-glycerol-phosphate synthase [Methanospirillum lacunae]PWR71450.1 indole-3-glycerol phosphate synthase [Methanospirillum lacunae]
MILDQIVQASTIRAEALTPGHMSRFADSRSMAHIGRERFSLLKAITGAVDRNSIIAEMKPASPSKGHLRAITDPVAVSQDLIGGGCCALSVITEPAFFHGSITTIPAIRDETKVPILRKDFIVDKKQIEETRNAGADAVLLITAVLGDQLGEFVDAARKAGLEPLVEVHDRQEVRTALDTGADLIGINNRNLKNLKTDLSTTIRLAPMIKRADRTVIAESGVTWPCDIRTLRSYANGYLIGSSIMAAENPRRRLEGFVYA